MRKQCPVCARIVHASDEGVILSHRTTSEQNADFCEGGAWTPTKGKPRGLNGGRKPLGEITRSVLFQARVTEAERDALSEMLNRLRSRSTTQE